MKTTTTMFLGLFGLMTLACGGSDDPANPETSGLQCGSAELFSLTHDTCGAMDAYGAPGDDGTECRCMIGYAWDGDACVGVGGCQCLGADCDKLAETPEACEQNHAACTGTPGFTCGSTALFTSTHDGCDAMDAKAMPDANGDCFCMLGFVWNGSSCEALTNCRCEGADCDKLTETQEACEQAHNACGAEPTTMQCGSTELFSLRHEVCGAMDARAVPDQSGQSCYCFLGYTWNGSACEGLADCACEGADCNKLTETQEACEQAHAACAN